MSESDGSVARDVQSILRARARALARPRRDTNEAGPSIEVLEFRLANERYALEIRHVREVVPLVDLTPVPCTPSFVLGIVNVRGSIRAVLDVKKLLDVPEQGLTDLHRIILVHGNGLEMGLLADEVVGVRTIALDSLQPLPRTVTVRADYLKGVAPVRVAVLDLDRILADPGIIVDEKVGK